MDSYAAQERLRQREQHNFILHFTLYIFLLLCVLAAQIENEKSEPENDNQRQQIWVGVVRGMGACRTEAVCIMI